MLAFGRDVAGPWGGLVALAFGSMILVDSPLPELQLNLRLVLPVVLALRQWGEDWGHGSHEIMLADRRAAYGDEHIRRAGAASLDLAYVAAGRLDGYYERGLHPWDLAAGDLIGGCMLKGQKIHIW